MAVKTYRLAATVVNNFGELVESDQSLATQATGWQMAKLASPQSSEMDVSVENTVFSSNATTAKPSGLITGTTANALRTTTALKGTFAATSWTIAVVLRSVTAAGGTVRVRMRVYKSANADGTGATELTGSTQVGTTTGALSTTADQTSTVTWSPGTTIFLNNEYLFFALALEVVTAGGSNSSDADLRIGSSTTGTRVVTPDYVAAVDYVDSGEVYLVLSPLLSKPFDSFTDDFASGTLTAVVWNWSGSPSAGARFIQLPCVSGGGTGFYTRQDKPYYDLTNTYVFALLEMPPVGSGSKITKMAVSKAGSTLDKMEFVCDGTNLVMRRLIANVISSSTSITYNATTHRFLRFRESGGTTFFDTSPDGETWTNRHSVTNAFDVRQCWLEFNTEYTGTESASNAVVRNVNVTPTRTDSGTITLTFTPSGTDIHGTGPSAYTDSGTVTLAFTPSATETTQFVDSGTTRLTFTPSATEEHTTYDSGTVTLVFTPSGTEQRISDDSGTVLLTFTPSSVEVYTPGGTIYTDSATVTLALTPSGTEFRAQQYTDSGTITLTLSPGAISYDQRATAQVTLKTDAANLKGIFYYLHWNAGTSNGYRVEILTDSTNPSADTWAIARIDGGSATYLDFGGTPEFLVGDTVGAEIIGTTITAFYIRGGSRTDLGDAVDATYPTGSMDYSLNDTVVFNVTNVQLVTLGAAETAQFVDTGTVRLTFTPSGTDQYDPGVVPTVDSGTIVLAFTPSGTEFKTAVDTATANLVFTPSGTEIREIVDTGTALLALSPSGTDVQVFADAGQLRLELTPSGVEYKEALDTGTINLVFTVSGTEQRISDDTATTYLLFTPSGVDTFAGAAAYTDSGTVNLLFTITGVELREQVDTATAVLLLTPSGTELRTITDVGTAILALNVSGTDERTQQDQGTITLQLTPSGTEFKGVTYADADTASIRFTPTVTETTTYVDSGQIGLAYTITGSDTFQAVQATTVDLRFSPSWSELYVTEGRDEGTVYVGLLPGGTESAQFVDAATVRITFTPSGTDTLTTEYADAQTVNVRLVPSGIELAAAVDTGQINLALTPSGIAATQHVDQVFAQLTLTPSGVEFPTQAIDYVDAGLLYLRLTITEESVYGLVLKSRAFLRWQSTPVETLTLRSRVFTRFTTNARGRWKAWSFKPARLRV